MINEGHKFRQNDSVQIHENDIELNAEQLPRVMSQQLELKDILASDSGSVTSRANNTKAIQ
jgi:hypothetical protein